MRSISATLFEPFSNQRSATTAVARYSSAGSRGSIPVYGLWLGGGGGGGVMYAYVDESGNTGANIFDKNQPDFFSAALITKSNFDLVYGPRVAAIADAAGVKTLHAGELGFGRIEPIAASVLAVLKKSDARFFISRIDKRYLLISKMFDTLFDSGENAAVPWTAYNLRPLRMILVFKLTMIVTDKIAKEFWNCILDKNEERAFKALPGICAAMLANIDNIPDARSRQILGDGLEWIIRHPKTLDIHIADKVARSGHLPNFVAFINLLDGIDIISKKWGRKVKLITHDEQSQFKSTLVHAHEIVTGMPSGVFRWAGEEHSLQKVADSLFEIRTDSDSSGIQVIDIVLWLFSRAVKEFALPPNCYRLLSYAFRKGLQHDFSFRGAEAAFEKSYGPMSQEPLTEEMIEKGRELSATIESDRQTLMAEFEKDGLKPYERGRIESPSKSLAIKRQN